MYTVKYLINNVFLRCITFLVVSTLALPKIKKKQRNIAMFAIYDVSVVSA